MGGGTESSSVIGARTDENAVYRNVHDPRASFQSHVLQRAFGGLSGRRHF